jgi:hypothetical protein
MLEVRRQRRFETMGLSRAFTGPLAVGLHADFFAIANGFNRLFP